MNRVPLDLESSFSQPQIGLATEATFWGPERRACQVRGVKTRQS
jgi:hypothetical protein